MQGCVKYGGLLSVLIKKLHGGKKQNKTKNKLFLLGKKKKGKDRKKIIHSEIFQGKTHILGLQM